MISINLTIHNKGFLIRRVLEAIKKNTIQDFEIVVVLDGCNDESEKEVSQFFKENHFINNVILEAPNVFETKANNMAAKASSGDHIIIIQDDVIINETGWDQRILKPFKAFTDVFAVTGRCAHNWCFNPNSRHIHEDFLRDDNWCDILNHIDHAQRGSIGRDVFAVRDSVNRSPLAINHADFETMGYFDEIFAPLDCDDHDLMYRMHKKLRKVCGCCWIEYISQDAWGGTRDQYGNPKDFMYRANHKNMRILWERHKDIMNVRQIENRKLNE